MKKQINLWVAGAGAIAFAIVAAKIMVDIFSQKNVWFVAPVVILVSFFGTTLGRFRGAVILPVLYAIVMLFLYCIFILYPDRSADAFSGIVVLAIPLLPSIFVTFFTVGTLRNIVSSIASKYNLHSLTDFLLYYANPYMLGLAVITALAINTYFVYRIGLAFDRANQSKKS